MENAYGKHSSYNCASSMLPICMCSSLDKIHEVILQWIASDGKMEASTSCDLILDIWNNLF